MIETFFQFDSRDGPPLRPVFERLLFDEEAELSAHFLCGNPALPSADVVRLAFTPNEIRQLRRP